MTSPNRPAAPEAVERDPDLPEVHRLLLDNHARFLAFVERRVGSRDVAEDILQEAFVRSLGRTGALRSSDSVTAWFYRVLRNAKCVRSAQRVTRGRISRKSSVARCGLRDRL